MSSPCLRVVSPCPLLGVRSYEAKSLGTEEDALKGPAAPRPGALPLLSQYSWENMGFLSTWLSYPKVPGFQTWQFAFRILTLHLLAVSRKLCAEN